jgi:Peptidase A4 family
MHLSPHLPISRRLAARGGLVVAAGASLMVATMAALPAAQAGAQTTAHLPAVSIPGISWPTQTVPATPHGLSGATTTNTHWSGYDATKGGYKSVTASWVVPQVSCTSDLSAVSFWTGLGGGKASKTASLVQQGVTAECDGSTPEYSAWWETISVKCPNPSNPYGGTVKPGDTITATTTKVGSNRWKMVVSDPAENWTASKTKPAACGTPASTTQTAEVITETPEFSFGLSDLPDFGTVTYTGAAINGSPLANANPGAIDIARSGVTMDTTSAISGGNSFQNIWKASS